MVHVLRVDASLRDEGSLSRRLGDVFMSALSDIRPDLHLSERDPGLNPPPLITSDWVAAAFTPAEDRTPEQQALLALSDACIAEVAAADIILITAPMYNYGMPAGLKAWVDLVVRKDRTFTFDLARGDFPLEPVLSGKTVVLLSAWGEFGFEPDGIRAGQGHLVGHVKAISRYLGASRFEHIAIEYQEFGDTRHRASIEAAHQTARALAMDLAQS